jgi:hypothetical protein
MASRNFRWPAVVHRLCHEIFEALSIILPVLIASVSDFDFAGVNTTKIFLWVCPGVIGASGRR